MKKWLLLCVVSLYAGLAEAQFRFFGFNQLDSLQQIEKRKVFVFVYTAWCGYCKAMQQQVFGKTDIQRQFAKDYYWIALNAEEQSPIRYRGHTFVFRASKGVHELAIAFTPDKKQMAYPFLAILDTNNQSCFLYEGFMNAAELKKVLAYFSVNVQ